MIWIKVGLAAADDSLLLSEEVADDGRLLWVEADDVLPLWVEVDDDHQHWAAVVDDAHHDLAAVVDDAPPLHWTEEDALYLHLVMTKEHYHLLNEEDGHQDWVVVAAFQCGEVLIQPSNRQVDSAIHQISFFACRCKLPLLAENAPN